jgi:hypothetical protein
MGDWAGPKHLWIAIAIVSIGGIAPFMILSHFKSDFGFTVPYPWDVTLIALIIIPTTICGAYIFIAGEIKELRSKK